MPGVFLKIKIITIIIICTTGIYTTWGIKIIITIIIP